jgi:hypothetical protein
MEAGGKMKNPAASTKLDPQMSPFQNPGFLTFLRFFPSD